MSDSSDPTVDGLRQRMAEIRSASHADVGTILTGLSQNLDWRYHFQRHPWAFAGAATVLGFLLIPKRRPKSELDPSLISQLAAELNLPEPKSEPQSFLNKWVLPLALKWGKSSALQVGQMLLAKYMARNAAQEAVAEEVEEAYIPPHRPR